MQIYSAVDCTGKSLDIDKSLLYVALMMTYPALLEISMTKLCSKSSVLI